MESILGLDREGLSEYLLSCGEKPFRTKQLMQWIHQRHCVDFDSMLDLSKALRQKLSETFEFNPLSLSKEQISKDGTIKWLLQTKGSSLVEAVYIPEETRATLCISSQVGCELNCKFCHTGTQGFDRNLSTAEIVGQIHLANRRLKELSEQLNEQKMQVTNVVFMGMGEPLRNTKNVIPAIKILLDDYAYGLSKKKVTVSTSGVVPGIEELHQSVDVALALSLHACDDKLRTSIIPINKKYPLELLLKTCNDYLGSHDRKSHITLEYVMLNGVNDSEKDAYRLAKIVNKNFNGRAKVNLIPFNPFPTSKYTSTPMDKIRQFAQTVRSKSVNTTIRKTRGEDILGACGQLAGDVQDKTRRRAKYLQALAKKDSLEVEVAQ